MLTLVEHERDAGRDVHYTYRQNLVQPPLSQKWVYDMRLRPSGARVQATYLLMDNSPGGTPHIAGQMIDINNKRTSYDESGTEFSYKFSPPASPPMSIWRHRLTSGLLANVQYSAVIIQGPAGHGKTTLMWQILQKRQESGARTCWLTLEEADNDISRFNTCFSALISSASTGGRDKRDVSSSETDGDSAIENILRLLSLTDGPVALFIDELQCIHEPVNIALLDSVIERSPQNITFYIGSRSVPSFVQGRLLISGRIKWITPQELCFTTAEVLDFLTAFDLDVSHAEAQEFREKTGGWPAVLQLLRLALKGGKVDRNTLLVWVRGCEEDLADYLADNIMLGQPANRKRFLLRTSVLNRFSVPLCEVITGDSDSLQIIRDLVSQGLFLYSVGPERKWFKYHSLFSGYLRSQLARTDASEILEVHKSAAQWFRGHGYPEDAIHHAAQAKEFELAADILDDCIPELIRNARLQTVDQLCALIPNEVFAARPRTCWRRIWAQQFLFQCDSARTLLEELGRVEIEGLNEAVNFSTSIKILKCSESIVNDDASALNFWADQIDIEMGEISKFRCFEMNALANVKGIKNLCMGRFAEAREWGLIGESLGERGEAAFSGAYSTTILAYAMIQDGHLLQALDRLKTALGKKELKIQGSFATASISALYGFALYESGNYIDAEIHLRDTIDMISQTLPLGWLIPAYLSLARASSLAENESSQSMEIIDNAERVGLAHRHPRIATAMRRERIRIALVNGNLDEARALKDIPEISQESRLPSGWVHIEEGCDDDLVSQARMHTYCGEPEDAISLLGPALEYAETRVWTRRKIKLLILSGLAHSATGATGNAKKAMFQALEVAAPRSYLASFLDEGKRCLSLISEMLGEMYPGTEDKQLADFMSRILQQAGCPIASAEHRHTEHTMIEPLTKRELAILKLVMAGATNKEISDQSFVSYNTVKFHMKNLYAKLGAKNRVDLTQVARSLKLT